MARLKLWFINWRRLFGGERLYHVKGIKEPLMMNWQGIPFVVPAALLWCSWRGHKLQGRKVGSLRPGYNFCVRCLWSCEIRWEGHDDFCFWYRSEQKRECSCTKKSLTPVDEFEQVCYVNARNEKFTLWEETRK